MARGAFKEREEEQKPHTLLAQAPQLNYEELFKPIREQYKQSFIDYAKKQKLNAEECSMLSRMADSIEKTGWSRHEAFEAFVALLKNQKFEAGMLATAEKLAAKAYGDISSALEELGTLLKNPGFKTEMKTLLEQIAEKTEGKAVYGALGALDALLKRSDYKEEMLATISKIIDIANAMDKANVYRFSEFKTIISNSKFKLVPEMLDAVERIAKGTLYDATNSALDTFNALIEKPWFNAETLEPFCSIIETVQTLASKTYHDAHIHLRPTEVFSVLKDAMNAPAFDAGMLERLAQFVKQAEEFYDAYNPVMYFEWICESPNFEANKAKVVKTIDYIIKNTERPTTLRTLAVFSDLLNNKAFKPEMLDAFHEVAETIKFIEKNTGGITAELPGFFEPVETSAAAELAWALGGLVSKPWFEAGMLPRFRNIVDAIVKNEQDKRSLVMTADALHSILASEFLDKEDINAGILEAVVNNNKSPTHALEALSNLKRLEFKSAQEKFKIIEFLAKNTADKIFLKAADALKSLVEKLGSDAGTLKKFRASVEFIVKNTSANAAEPALWALQRMFENPGFKLDSLSEFRQGVSVEAAVFNAYAKVLEGSDKAGRANLADALQPYANWFSRHIDEITERREYGEKRAIFGQMSTTALYFLLGTGTDEFHESNFTMPFDIFMEREENKGKRFTDVVKRMDQDRILFSNIFGRAISNKRVEKVFPKTLEEQENVALWLVQGATGGKLAVLQRVMESGQRELEGLKELIKKTAVENAKTGAAGRALLYNFAEYFSDEEFAQAGLAKPSETVFNAIPTSLAGKQELRAIQFFHPGPEYGLGREYQDFEDARNFLKGKGFDEKEEGGRFILTRKIQDKTIVYELVKGSPAKEDVERIRQGAFQVIAHRGHASDEEKTFTTKLLENLPADVVLYNGSCQGFNRIESLFRWAGLPITISTKGTGMAVINNPLLHYTMEEIALGRTLWDEISRNAKDKTRQDPYAAQKKGGETPYAFPHETKPILYKYYLTKYQYELNFITSQPVEGVAPVAELALEKALEKFREKWGERKKVSKLIIDAAEEVVKENEGRWYSLGEWDCALFTREVYHRAISRLFLEVLAEADLGASYGVRTDIGKTTYEQWNAMQHVIERSPESSVLNNLEERNTGDLVFHKLREEEVAHPNPRELYGHAAITSTVKNGERMGYDNSFGGASERPVARMFQAAPIDQSAEPLLIVGRPDFTKLETRVEGNSIILSTSGEHPITVEIRKF